MLVGQELVGHDDDSARVRPPRRPCRRSQSQPYGHLPQEAFVEGGQPAGHEIRNRCHVHAHQEQLALHRPVDLVNALQRCQIQHIVQHVENAQVPVQIAGNMGECRFPQDGVQTGGCAVQHLHRCGVASQTRRPCGVAVFRNRLQRLTGSSRPLQMGDESVQDGCTGAGILHREKIPIENDDGPAPAQTGRLQRMFILPIRARAWEGLSSFQ